MKLRDRIALVTGGGSGIGRAIALHFAEEGARVVVNDIDLAAAEKTLHELSGSAPRGHAIQADVADSGQVKAMFATIERELGGLDVLVNNAGIALGPGEQYSARTQRAEARIMETLSGQGIQTHWDVTENLSDEAWRRSLAALTGLESAPHYSAAKGGVLAFTRAVAREVASRGIRVNAIAPGYIDTPMTEPMSPLVRAAVHARTPLGRSGEPREIAATALFLASDDSSFFTGQWLSPNGGLFIG